MIGLRLALLLCLLIPSALHAAMSAQELQKTFEEANAAYQSAQVVAESDVRAARANYRRAALRYERLIRDGGRTNGRMYFNLGNSLLGAGDVGRAILNYRRALTYLPGDAATERNLEIARRRRSQAVVFRKNAGWQVSPGMMLAGFAVTWIIFWALLAVRLYRPGQVKTSLLASAGAICTVMLIWGVASAADFGRDYGVLTAAQSVARQGDGLSYESALAEPLKAGEEFRVLQSVGDWSRVELASGESVWLQRRDFETTGETP